MNQESLPKKKKSQNGNNSGITTGVNTTGRPGKPPKFPKSKHEKTTTEQTTETFFEMEPIDETTPKSEPINIKTKRWKK
jgi:hypothetical protein